MTPIIDFRDVHYTYPVERPSAGPSGPRGVSGITLTLQRGELVALVGRSGSGKSTLLKLANRLLLPQAGTVIVDGRDTREWDPIALRRRTGYVLQEIGLLPHLSVQDNVTLVPRLEGWQQERRTARAVELLALFGLPAELARRWPRELSGGQRQRVGVARALAVDPPVLLMDEPFGALDPITRTELQREFQRIQRQLQQTVLLVTHDITEAFALGTRVGVIDSGRLVICDSPSVVARATDSRVRQLLDALPPLAVSAPRDSDGRCG